MLTLTRRAWHDRPCYSSARGRPAGCIWLQSLSLQTQLILKQNRNKRSIGGQLGISNKIATLLVNPALSRVEGGGVQYPEVFCWYRKTAARSATKLWVAYPEGRAPLALRIFHHLTTYWGEVFEHPPALSRLLLAVEKKRRKKTFETTSKMISKLVRQIFAQKKWHPGAKKDQISSFFSRLANITSENLDYLGNYDT